MANSRLISSAIWQDDWFGPLDYFDQVLWIGLFSNCADDQGRLLDNPIVIRAAVFLYKDVPIDDVGAAIQRFADAGRICRYEADGKSLVQIINWWEYQQPQWASASKWPAPSGWMDHVRTRQNNKYFEQDWLGKDHNADAHVGWVPVQVNDQVNDQLSGHVPIPISVPIPVPENTTQAQAQAPDAPEQKADKPKADKPKKELGPIGHAIAEVCLMKPDLLTQNQFGQIFTAARVLGKAEYTPEDIRALFGEDGKWYWGYPGIDSQGMKIPPRIDQIRSEIERVKARTRPNGNGHGPPRASPQANDAWANADVAAIIESNAIKERHV